MQGKVQKKVWVRHPKTGKQYQSVRWVNPTDAKDKSKAKVDPKEVYQKMGTRSPFFKAWFGDWEKAFKSGDYKNVSHVVDGSTGQPRETASAAVDDEGNPIPVYHGSFAQFDTFDERFANLEAHVGPGFYFSSQASDSRANYMDTDSPDVSAKLAQEMDNVQGMAEDNADEMSLPEKYHDYMRTSDDWADFREEYEEATGEEFDPANFDWWAAYDIDTSFFDHVQTYFLNSQGSQLVECFLNMRKPFILNKNPRDTELNKQFPFQPNTTLTAESSNASGELYNLADEYGSVTEDYEDIGELQESGLLEDLRGAMTPSVVEAISDYDVSEWGKYKKDMESKGLDPIRDFDPFVLESYLSYDFGTVLRDVAEAVQENDQPSGVLIDLIDSVERIANEIGEDTYGLERAMQEIREELLPNGGINDSATAHEFFETVTNALNEHSITMITDDGDSVMAAGAVFNKALREAGFDGIMYADAYQYFPSIVEPNTQHYVVFGPNQIKATNNEGNFSAMDNSIYKAVTLRKLTIFQRIGNLLKARSTKYYKRLPTGNPKRPWKYYYSKESYEKEHGKGAGEKVEKTKQAILDGLLSLEGTQRWQKKGQDRVYVSRADSRFLSAEDQAELPQQSRTLYYDVKKGEFIVSGFGDKVKAVLTGIKNAIMGKQSVELSAEDVARNEAVTLPEDQPADKVGEVEPVAQEQESEDNFDTMPEEEGGMEDNPGKDEYNDQLDIFKDAQPEEKKLAETPAIKDKEKLKQVREYASDKNTDDSYRYQDIGYVPGSRKEEAANQIRIRSKEGKRITAELIDWLSLEKNPREAEKLINKKTLFGEVNWADYEARGVDPAAAFLIGRIYAAIPKDPLIKSQTGRFYYTKGINEVRDRFDNCTSVEGVKEALDDLYDQFTGVSFLPDEAERMQEIKKQFREIREREDAYREFSRKAYDEYDAIYSKNQGIKYEYVKAERRGWKNKLPELKEAADRADAETKAAWEAYRAKLEAHPEYEFFKTESKPYDPKTGKEITEEEAQKYEREIDVNTPSGISYRKIIQQAPRRSMGPAEDIRFALNKEAKTIQENARERHINSEQFAVIASLGEDFYKTLNYRSGKTAFSKHYAQAKAGKIKDYSWAEKGTTSGRTATKQSARFQLKVADRYNREGGRPVAIESSKDYTDKFRFRAVQSGNYVLNDFNAAKFHIERSAEAYVDLADFLGIPEHYVSLGGELAMAFGARGRGTEGWQESAARAHYEPTYRVINITKNSGGGSLGHEWVHAVDNILALQEREKTGVDKDEYSDSVFVSENPAIIESARVRSAVEKLVSVMEAGDLPETMKYEAKPVSQSMVERNIKGQLAQKWFASGDYATTVREIQDYFGMQDLLQVKYKELSRMEKKRLRAAKSWVDVAVAYYTQNYNGGQVQIPTGNTVSKFLKWAQDTDGGAGPGKKYWSSRHELFARAFQSYIEDGLAVDGRKNDYLSVYADNKYHVSPIFGPQYPYPEGEERKKINAAFGEFFQAMKEEGYWDKLNTFAKAMFAAMRKQMGPILKAAGEFESGQIVSYDGKPAVYCEDKHGKAKLIVKGSSGPEFDFVPVGELEPYDGDIPEDFERYAGHWETLQDVDVSTLLKAANLEEAFADLLKAGTEGKVLVPMTIIRGGKAVRTHRWMNPKDAAKPDRGRVNKDSEGNTVVSIGKKSKTYQALIPSKETFKAIQGGDADALANYLQEKFWTSPIQTEQDIKTPFGVEKRVRPESGSVTVVNQLAAAFRKSKIEGYDLEDLVQETALSLLENQSNGKLQNVAYDKFPSYIASTMANLNRNLRRKSRIDKQVGTAIDDMAEYLSGGGDVAEAYEVAEAQQIVKKTTDRVKERLMDWIETTGVRNKKDVPVVKSVVNQYFRGRSSQAIANSTGVDEGKVRNWVSRYVTSNRQLDKIARDAGYSGRTAVKDFIDDWRQVNNFHKAVLVRRGNLILRKADKGGDDWSGDEGNEHGVFEKIDLHGLGIAIENPVGSIRSGVDENGVPWEIQMDHAYGFIMNTEGMDGEEIDVFVGPYQNSENVYVITIRDPKEGVEDKVFLGYRSGKEAMDTFESHYSNPYDFVDKVSEYTLAQFLQAISSGKKSLAKAKAEVGETRTRKDGRKYRKVSEGQWELVSEGQGAGKKDAPGSQKDKQGQDQKGSKGGEAQGPKESFKRRMADAVKNFVKNLAGALEDTFAGDSSVGGISETTGGLGEAAKKETEARDANRAKNKADTDAAEKKAKDKLAGGKDK